MVAVLALAYHVRLHSASTKPPCAERSLLRAHETNVDGDDTYKDDEEEIALREDVSLSGFPTEALTIDDARMCDAEMQVRVRLRTRSRLSSDTLVCDEDPSCRKCYPERVNDTNRLLALFHGAAYTATRQKHYDTYLDRSEVVTVIAVNLGQAPFVLNWHCSLRAAPDIDERAVLNNTIVLATDHESADLFRARGIPVIAPPVWKELHWNPWKKKRSDYISPRYDFGGSGGSGRHAIINFIGLFACNELLKQGYAVIHHDADIVWLKSPARALKRLARRRDVLGSRGTGGLNAGFVYFRPTHHAKIFLQSLVNLSPLQRWSGQAMFNAVLRHYKLSQVTWRALPDRLFPGEAPIKPWGCAGRSKYAGDGKTQLLDHRVGSWKMQGFQECGRWFLDPRMREKNVWVKRNLNMSWFEGKEDLCFEPPKGAWAGKREERPSRSKFSFTGAAADREKNDD